MRRDCKHKARIFELAVSDDTRCEPTLPNNLRMNQPVMISIALPLQRCMRWLHMSMLHSVRHKRLRSIEMLDWLLHLRLMRMSMTGSCSSKPDFYTFLRCWLIIGLHSCTLLHTLTTFSHKAHCFWILSHLGMIIALPSPLCLH